MQLGELELADASILKIESTSANVKITLRDWKGKKWLIMFNEFLALQNFNIEGEDLSHIQIKTEDLFKTFVMKAFQDESFERFLCFDFYGVWSDMALLKVVATHSYEILEIPL